MTFESPFISSFVFLVGNPFRRQLWLWQGVISTKARKTFMWWRRKRSESLHRMCKLHLLDDLLAMILRDKEICERMIEGLRHRNIRYLNILFLKNEITNQTGKDMPLNNVCR